MKARDVTTWVSSVIPAAWAKLAGPVVQLRTTGSLPARCKAMRAMSHATEAGIISPTLGDGIAAKRRLMARAAVSMRSYVSAPARSSAATTSRIVQCASHERFRDGFAQDLQQIG